MSYEVRCECGKVYPVGAADAGVSFACACGREVNVPALHMLRTAAGQMGVSPVVQLQAMLIQNELPGTVDCARCHRQTEHLIRVSVVCERVITEGGLKKQDVAAGCFSALLFGLPALLVALQLRDSRTPSQRGNDVSFVVPVQVCEACAHGVAGSEDVRALLRATPIYAAVLEQYPQAIIRRVT